MTVQLHTERSPLPHPPCSAFAHSFPNSSPEKLTRGPGRGFLRDGSGWPWSPFAPVSSVSSCTRPTGPGRRFSTGAIRSPSPGDSGQQFWWSPPGEGVLVASGGRGWVPLNLLSAHGCPRNRVLRPQTPPVPGLRQPVLEGSRSFKRGPPPCPQSWLDTQTLGPHPDPRKQNLHCNKLPGGTQVGWTVCEARVWRVDPPSHGMCWSLSAHCLVAPRLGLSVLVPQA